MFPRYARLAMTPLVIPLMILTSAPATAQRDMTAAVTTPAPPSSYADVADLAIDAATIIDAQIRRARAVPPEQAGGIPPHLVRMYVEADINTAIYGSAPVAWRVGFLVDQVRLPNGRAPRLNRQRVLLFARAVAVSNRLQLINPQAMLAWDAGRDATVRSIVAERVAGPVPPAIASVSQAFHVRGTVAGESETQIFLRTTDGDPVSLSILRRPGESPRWAVAFGEIVDESATIPQRRTLGWYRLACGLPAALPPTAISTMESRDARVTAEDYALVLRSLGPCDRSVATPVAAPPLQG